MFTLSTDRIYFDGLVETETNRKEPEPIKLLRFLVLIQILVLAYDWYWLSNTQSTQKQLISIIIITYNVVYYSRLSL